MTFAIRKKPKILKNTQFVWSWSYRNYNSIYYNDVLHADWYPVLNTEDPETAVSMFYHILLAIIDKHAPYKFIKTKGGCAKWVTNEFLSLLDNRRYRLDLYNKYPTDDNWQLKEEAIRLVRNMKLHLQQEHIQDPLNAAGKDSKVLCKTLKEIWPTKNKSS